MDTLIGGGIGHSARKAGGAAGGADAGDAIRDGDQKTFIQYVIEASRTRPILVDFWATWCGPCKQLTPILEKVVRAAGGRVGLVKIDIDKNRPLMQQLASLGLPMQSVPTVAAFWKGQIADVVQGALRESEVKQFVEALLKLAGGSMPAADLLAQARQAVGGGDMELAADLFGALLAEDPESPEAWGGLTRALAALGEEEEARATLDKAPASLRDHPEISGARNALALAAEGRRAAAGMAQFEARLARDPDDHEARFDLATALAAANRREEAAEALLHVMRRDRTWREDGARLQLLRFFEAWGLEDPATLGARRKLSSMLFN